MVKKYYELLGITETATQAEIKSAYRRLVLEHHPDKGGDQEEFVKIKHAYEILSNESNRKKYDDWNPQDKKSAWNNWNWVSPSIYSLAILKIGGARIKHCFVGEEYDSSELGGLINVFDHEYCPESNRSFDIFNHVSFCLGDYSKNLQFINKVVDFFDNYFYEIKKMKEGIILQMENNNYVKL